MVHESTHPLIKHKLSMLRATSTDSKQFRELVREITQLLCYEATAALPTQAVSITTPMGDAQTEELSVSVGLIPILRAGLGMVDPMLALIPSASVWFLGMYRNEETLQPVYYYDPFKADASTVDIALILDPMLATGGSANFAIDKVKAWGVKNIKFLSLISAPEGIKALQEKHPDVPIHTASIDSHLNDIGYIVPGLGDAGDRQFNT